MSQEWGRNEYAGEWPNRHPLWRYAVIFLALVSVATVCVYRYAEVFPVHLYRKFGFNPPLGVFLDHFGGYAVEKALGNTAYSAYREHFRNLDPPRSQMESYDSQPDLTDEEVLATWHEGMPDEDPNSDFEEKIVMRASVMKAKMRVILWSISYQRNTIEMPDITEFVRELEEVLPQEAKDPESPAGSGMSQRQERPKWDGLA